jgi:hypothetical protein
MNEIQNYSFICQTDKFISIKNRNDESIINKIIIFLFFIIAVIAMQLSKDFTRFHWIIHDHVIHELYCLKIYFSKYKMFKVLLTYILSVSLNLLYLIELN